MQQAQLYYAEKSRYIGVFDSKEKANLGYEIARRMLNPKRGGESGTIDNEAVLKKVKLARKAAFEGVAELNSLVPGPSIDRQSNKLTRA